MASVLSLGINCTKFQTDLRISFPLQYSLFPNDLIWIELLAGRLWETDENASLYLAGIPLSAPSYHLGALQRIGI